MRSISMAALKRLLKAIKPLLPAKLQAFYREFRWQYPFRDRSQVVLYAPVDCLPDYPLRRDPSGAAQADRQPVKVSLIATVRNEAASSAEWMNTLLRQTRLPDEVVIVDGGSSDATLAILQGYANQAPFPIKLISSPGANIARGRNLAIQNSAHPVVACTDFGCRLEADWLEQLCLPFELDPQIEASAGYYQVVEEAIPEKLAAHFFMVVLANVDPQTFLPSSRNLALRKSLWEKAAPYPEWLSDAGEDTLFDYQAKSQAARWAFVPQAKVTWRPPDSLKKLFKTYYRYAVGDGEVGSMARHYWWKAIQFARLGLRGFLVLTVCLLAVLVLKFWGLVLLLVLAGLGLVLFVRKNLRATRELELGSFYPYTAVYELLGIFQVLGYARGVANRPQVHARQVKYYQVELERILQAHSERAGVIVYPPTHDWGFMFQRPHQMARAFAREGYLYFYCTANEITDAVVGFWEVEPGLCLSHVPLETFQRLPGPIVYIGSAWNANTLPFFDRPRLIYDHYDDLEVSGARRQDHQDLLERADLVLVTTHLLKDALQVDQAKLLLIPNGVDYTYIQQARHANAAAPPPDWPPLAAQGKPVIGYSGALAQWFDYDLLADVAAACPDLEFILIGVDYDGSLADSHILECGNIHWLGMKTYAELFGYIDHFDVGIIPFKVNNITRATSPIKLFEYLACGKPAVSTPLPECRDYPGVFIAETPRQFVDLLRQALQAGQDSHYLDTIEQVARANTWQSRVEQILARIR